MYHFIPRRHVIDCLKIGNRQSYRLIRPSMGNSCLVRDSDVVSLLNRSRTKTQPEVSSIPCDIMTPEELANRMGGYIRESILKRAVKRRINPIPAFVFGPKCIRYSEREVDAWARR